MGRHFDVTEALGTLLVASVDAHQAYRAIFGKSAWNSRDREAFKRLEAAIHEAKTCFDQQLTAKPHESLRARITRGNLCCCG